MEACLAGHLDKPGKQRMEKGFPHEVMIDIAGLSGELPENMGVLRLRHLPGRAVMPMAEGTVHIANIGDLYIDTGKHNFTSGYSILKISRVGNGKLLGRGKGALAGAGRVKTLPYKGAVGVTGRLPRRPFGPPRNDNCVTIPGKKNRETITEILVRIVRRHCRPRKDRGELDSSGPSGGSLSCFGKKVTKEADLRGQARAPARDAFPLRIPQPLVLLDRRVFQIGAGRNLNCCRHDTGRNRDA